VASSLNVRASSILGCFFLVGLVASIPLAAAQENHETITAEIVSERFSSGYFPVVGSYVEYELMLTNKDDIVVENQSLWATLASDGNQTRFATYFLSRVEPGGQKTIHLGPFKMEDEGWYELKVGIGNATLDFQPGSFMVYRQDPTWIFLVGISAIMAGAGITWFSLYRKKMCRDA
jgi:hypothetical protein